MLSEIFPSYYPCKSADEAAFDEEQGFIDQVVKDKCVSASLLKSFIQSGRRLEIESAREIYLLTLLLVELEVTGINLIFDLVPGIGKTFSMVRLLAKLGEDSIQICTPTAISSHLYGKSCVRTVHSFFKIDPKLPPYAPLDLKHFDTSSLEKKRVVVFDEFSMISAHLFKRLFQRCLRQLNIPIILIGDTSQLKPPRGSLIKFSHGEKGFFTIVASEQCKIYRFENTPFSEQLKKHIFRLKRLISVHESHAQKCSGKISVDENMLEWLSFFDMFNVHLGGERITTASTMNLIAGAYAENSRNALCSTGLFVKPPIIFSYMNKDNFEKQDEIFSRSKNESAIRVLVQGKVLEDTAGCLEREFSNLFFYESEFARNNAHIKEMIKTSKNVFDSRNKFFRGVAIRCRKNNSFLNNVNGEVGVLLEIQLCFDILPAQFSKRIVTVDGISVAYTLVDEQCNFRLGFKYFSFRTNKVVTNVLKMQEHKICSTQKITFASVNWTSYFTATLFNVQGQTIFNDELFIEANKCLVQNKLRSMYLLVTRVRDPKQIHIDIDFIVEGLRSIYCSKKPRERFLKDLVEAVSKFPSHQHTQIMRDFFLEAKK